MATCTSCGEPLRDAVWVCGVCGAPVAATAGRQADDPYAEASVSSLPAAPPPPTKRGLTTLTKSVLVGGLVAVLAVAAIWFFVLRSPGDTYFVGTWSSSAGGQVRIERAGGGFHLFMIDKEGKSLGPFKTTMSDGVLETRLEPAGGSDQEKATANLARALLAAMFSTSDFSLQLHRGDDANHATMSVAGVSGTSSVKEAAVLTREQ